MTKRNVPAAIAVFLLQSEAYPDRWRPFFNLGEVYKIRGQQDRARTYYQKGLANDLANQQILSRLNALNK